ncbi:energy transducer TonB [Myxococcaceae bacterium GXIMD 01537]
MTRIRLVLATVAALALAPMALAAGGPRLQTFFQADLRSASYQKKVYERVARNWKQPPPKQAPAPGKKVIVQALIAQDGKLLSSTITTESGSKAWDASVLSAVKKSAPFEPLPAGFTSPTLEVHFHLGWVAN